jgi:uncharacterized BrkB/YihY/UPF0761 family membrane protein
MMQAEPSMNSIPQKNERSSSFHSGYLILFGIILGVIAAYLISQGLGLLAVAAIGLIPLAFYFSAHPFMGLLLWLLVMPFVSALPISELAYWTIYRILPPVLLCRACLKCEHIHLRGWAHPNWQSAS